MTVLQEAALWLLAAALVPVNLYPLIYMFRPWRSTPQGRALMLKAVGNMILLDLVFLNRAIPPYPGHDLVQLIGIALFVGGIFYLFWSLVTSPGSDQYPPRSWWRRRSA